MAVTMVQRLLWLANDLSCQSTKPKSQTLRRRAVSTGYYAVFHALALLCAKELLDGDDKTARSVEFERVYRALDHGSLKTAFRSAPLKDLEPIKLIGERVVELQSERIRSDYLPPGYLYKQAESALLVQSATTCVEMIARLSPTERRTLAVYLVFKNRTS